MAAVIDHVAVKLMLSRAQADAQAFGHLRREMQVIAGLKHPNIVSVLDSGSYQGTFLLENPSPASGASPPPL